MGLFLRCLILILFCYESFSVARAVEIDWDDLGQGNASTLVSGSSVAATNNACSPGQVNCNVIATVTYQLVNDGVEGDLGCLWNGGVNCARFYNTPNGGIDDGNLRFGLNADEADNDDYLNICIEFDRVVEGLMFEILDIDEQGWDDVVELYYATTPSATPMLDRVDLVNGVEFGDTTSGNDANHVVLHDLAFFAPNNEATGWGAIQPGGGNASTNDDGGNVSVDFLGTNVWGFCMRYWAGPDSNFNPPAQSIGLSDLIWTSSLPVNLDEFKSMRRANSLDLSWVTSSETFNLGFNLWAEQGGEWHLINDQIVSSKSNDSRSLLRYKKNLKLKRAFKNIRQIGISSIDTSGREEFYGPFKVGEAYGLASVPEAIDWQTAVEKSSQRMKAKGFVKRKKRWVREKKGELNRVNIGVHREGMVRITHQNLVSKGIDLTGISVDRIAITHRGDAVSRHINATGRSRRFNKASYIDFYATSLEGELALYNLDNFYQIVLDPDKVRKARTKRATFTRDPNIASYLIRSITYEQNSIYQWASTFSSPWLDASIGWGANPSLDRVFSLPTDYQPSSDLEITIDLMGGFDFPNVDEDHQVNFSLNGKPFGVRAWGGIESQTFKFLIPPGLFDVGLNTLQMEAVATEAGFALVHLDKYEISYKAVPKTNGGTPDFTLARDKIRAPVFALKRDINQRLWGYANDKEGNLLRLSHKAVRSKTGNEAKPLLLLPQLSVSDSRYWILTDQQFVSPDIELVEYDTQEAGSAELYIIADESFIGDELKKYVDFKRSVTIRTELISYQSLLSQFGHGFDDPYVIRSFLKYQNAEPGEVSVLIVGGHTFDYLDRMNSGSISFVPTAYRAAGVMSYSPTDSPLVDLDSDGMPDVAVGRWPVRTIQQLTDIIDKSSRWELGEGLSNMSSTLLIADNDDRNNALAFSNQLDSIASQFDSNSKNFPDFWSNITRVYAEDFSGEVNAVSQQRSAIEEAMTRGNALIIFNGHASPTSWSFKRLFDVNAVDRIEYKEGPSLIAPLACYTTYYESINDESFANKLLFEPAGGAVAIVGPTTLGDYYANEQILVNMMKLNALHDLSLGESLRLAKRSLGIKKVEQANVWTLLADPTLNFNKNYQAPIRTSSGVLEE